MMEEILVIGGGLAGSEAAWQIARAGLRVRLWEMRPDRSTEAHHTSGLAELVCSNSLRSDDADYSAIGLLHEEMRKLGSLIFEQADLCRVPAGGALAVDRDQFSTGVTERLAAHPNVTIERRECRTLPPPGMAALAIIATGPLTTPELAEDIRALTGVDNLSFFDAIAPIVYKDSVDFTRAWAQSRYDKGTGTDYINLPLDREQYDHLIDQLLAGERHMPKDWEGTPYFEGCLPVEVMAERGRETLAYGPAKPVGLTNPHNPTVKPRAIVQLRQDNALGTLYNMVGFQTKLKHSEQIRIFRTIPGLENAEFARLGGMHRNTFINSPKTLDGELRLKARPDLRFAGQITGCEGYGESAAIGLIAGRFAAAERLGRALPPPPIATALGALLNHVTKGADADSFQPMNVNFGLFPEPPPAKDQRGRRIKGRDRKKLYAERARIELERWIEETS